MSQDRNDASHDYEYVYHWDRIVAAALALALVVGGLYWGLGSKHPSAPVAETEVTTPPPAVATLPPPVATTGDSTAQAPSPTGTVSSPVSPDKPAIAPALAPASSPTRSEPVADAQRSNPTATAPGKLLQGEVRIASSRVTSASLNQVIDQEALPIAKGVIDVGPRKAVRVMFSADIAAPGESVTYHWFYEGKQAVSVKTRVSPEGRSVGSKYISFDTPGDWQVQLTDASGKVLAEAAVKARRK